MPNISLDSDKFCTKWN